MASLCLSSPFAIIASRHNALHTPEERRAAVADRAGADAVVPVLVEASDGQLAGRRPGGHNHRVGGQHGGVRLQGEGTHAAAAGAQQVRVRHRLCEDAGAAAQRLRPEAVA